MHGVPQHSKSVEGPASGRSVAAPSGALGGVMVCRGGERMEAQRALLERRRNS